MCVCVCELCVLCVLFVCVCVCGVCVCESGVCVVCLCVMWCVKLASAELPKVYRACCP